MPEGSAATAEQTESDVGYDAEMERLCEAEYQRTRRGQWERTQQMRPGPSRDLDGRSERAAKKQRRYEEEIARGQAQRDQRRKDEDAAARAEEEQLKKRRLFELHRELKKNKDKGRTASQGRGRAGSTRATTTFADGHELYCH